MGLHVERARIISNKGVAYIEQGPGASNRYQVSIREIRKSGDARLNVAVAPLDYDQAVAAAEEIAGALDALLGVIAKWEAISRKQTP